MRFFNSYSLEFFTFRIGFDEGSPDGNDPLQIARQMASRGITLVRMSCNRAMSFGVPDFMQFFVACEPALSGYAVGIPHIVCWLATDLQSSMPPTSTRPW